MNDQELSRAASLSATVDRYVGERDALAVLAREYIAAVGDYLTSNDMSRDALDRAHDLLEAAIDGSSPVHREAVKCTKCKGLGRTSLAKSNPRMQAVLDAMPTGQPVTTIALAIHMGLKETTTYERLSWLERAGFVRCVGKVGHAFEWRAT